MDYRQPGRLLKLKPADTRATPLGVIRMSGPDGSSWWSNGEAIWSEAILDPTAKALLESRERPMKDQPPIDLFWPRSARVKLVFKQALDFRGDSLGVYEGGGIRRLVNLKTRPPKILYAPARALSTPILVVEPDTENVTRIGKFRGSEDQRNEALVDAPSIESATMMVMPFGEFPDLTNYIDNPEPVDYAPPPAPPNDTDRPDNSGARIPEQAIRDLTLEVPEYRYDAFDKTIAKLKKLSTKLGIDPPKVELLGMGTKQLTNPDTGKPTGQAFETKKYKVDLPPAFKFPGDYAVLAKIEKVGDGQNLVQSFDKDNAQLPDELWSIPMRCDHCGKDRKRNAVYLLENRSDGDRKVIGKSCIADFTGHPAIADLCSLADMYTSTVESLGEDDEIFRLGNFTPSLTNLESFLTQVAMIVRVRGRYITRKQADNSMGSSTIDEVIDYKNSKVGESKIGPPTEADAELAKAAIEWAKNLDSTSDFERNMSVVANAGYVKEKFFGTAGYIIPAYLRTQAAATQEKRLAAPFDPSRTPYPEGKSAGDKIEFQAKLDFRTAYDTQFGTTHLLKFIDDGGRVYSWKTGSPPSDLSLGVVYDVKATIKKFGEYKGEKQTEIQRAKVTPAKS